MILKIDTKFIQGEFQGYQQQALLKLPQDVKSCIDVDIHRSYTTMKGVTGENLRRILTTYAVVNRDLDYC